ncbi:MAG: hypothetical protein JWM94_2201 [Sphingomonas bacterium]|nr:hypothetical protein [Sphingomonas bacterium]
MLDGAALPHVGATAILRRSEIEIGTTVIWRSAGRCGVKFEGVASVDEWVAGARLPNVGFGHGQTRVDAIQAAIRGGTFAAVDETPPDTATVSAAELDARIAEEFAYIARLLDDVGDEFTDDPLILQRHGQALQNLDIACQLLNQLAAITGATDRAASVAAVTMGEMKNRLQRKTMF